MQLLQEEIIENEEKHERENMRLEKEYALENERNAEIKNNNMNSMNNGSKVTFSESEGEGHFVTAPSTPSVADPASDDRRSMEITEGLATVSFMTREIDEEAEGEPNEGVKERIPNTPTALLNCLNDVHIEGKQN